MDNPESPALKYVLDIAQVCLTIKRDIMRAFFQRKADEINGELIKQHIPFMIDELGVGIQFLYRHGIPFDLSKIKRD